MSFGTPSYAANARRGKPKVVKVNATSTELVTLDGNEIEKVETFSYLGSIIDKQGGTDADVKARIGKARGAFI